jgi:hypothetical protein
MSQEKLVGILDEFLDDIQFLYSFPLSQEDLEIAINKAKENALKSLTQEEKL